MMKLAHISSLDDDVVSRLRVFAASVQGAAACPMALGRGGHSARPVGGILYAVMVINRSGLDLTIDTSVSSSPNLSSKTLLLGRVGGDGARAGGQPGGPRSGGDHSSGRVVCVRPLWVWPCVQPTNNEPTCDNARLSLDAPLIITWNTQPLLTVSPPPVTRPNNVCSAATWLHDDCHRSSPSTRMRPAVEPAGASTRYPTRVVTVSAGNVSFVADVVYEPSDCDRGLHLLIGPARGDGPGPTIVLRDIRTFRLETETARRPLTEFADVSISAPEVRRRRSSDCAPSHTREPAFTQRDR